MYNRCCQQWEKDDSAAIISMQDFTCSTLNTESNADNAAVIGAVGGNNIGVISAALELDLRFNVILFGIVRLDQVRRGIESTLRFNENRMESLSSYRVEVSHAKQLITLLIND